MFIYLFDLGTKDFTITKKLNTHKMKFIHVFLNRYTLKKCSLLKIENNSS